MPLKLAQNSDQEPRKEITNQQVADAELVIQSYWPAAKGLGAEFRVDLNDALTLVRDCYELALGPVTESKPVKRRELETLRRAIAVAGTHLRKQEIENRIADFAVCPSVPEGEADQAYETWCEWQSKRDDIAEKIEGLKAALAEMQAVLDVGLAKENSKHTEAIPRHETKAMALAAGAFLSQVEHWGIPTALWHHNMEPSPAASIIAGVLEILAIKSSARTIAALKPGTDPDFGMPVLAVPTRARGMRR